MRSSTDRIGVDAWDWGVRALIVLSLAALTYSQLSGTLFRPIFDAIESHSWSEAILRPSWLWLIMGSLLLCFRTLLWFRYRPLPPVPSEGAPTLTVIIPAFNEGAMVERSIVSVAQARYPRDRLEIIAIDDGSKDDTWTYIEAAAERYPDLVTAIRFPVNQGKRAALAEGFRRARGEVVITIDSDSVIETDTLLAMVAPFQSPKVGAVAGKVAAYNRRDGFISRMLHVQFILSFDFLRAVQSTYGTVYCCPGALAAYRTDLVRRVLERWESQTFLGAACTIGEDRALTNFILAEGYDTVYQQNAVVHTLVPVTYGKLCKMYLRWDRSFVREELRFLGRVVWRRPAGTRLIALMDTTITNLRYPVMYANLGLLVALAVNNPDIVLRLLVVMGIMSAFSMLYYIRSEKSWDFIYGILYSYFSFFTLFWIFPYAAMTARAKSWLTR